MVYYAHKLPVIPSWLPIMWPTGVYRLTAAIYEDKLKKNLIGNLTVFGRVTNNMLTDW